MIQGRLHPHFDELASVLERQIRGNGGGAAICVYLRGEPVVDIWAGTRDDEGTPWERGTMAMSFSTTKGVTSTALHLLVDRGLLSYDDPISLHWPEFAAGGKEAITIRQLLCHEAGLHNIRGLVDDGERMMDWDHMVRALEAAEPGFEPGSHNAYHGITFGWLVGEIVQRVSGRPFSEFIQEELARPLGLDGLFIGTPASEQSRAAQLKTPIVGLGDHEYMDPYVKGISRASKTFRLPFDPGYLADALLPKGVMRAFWHPDILSAPIPAANGLFTARALARLYALLAEGGTLDGASLLSGRTLRHATEVQNRRVDRVVPVAMHWRLGYHRVFTTRGSPKRAFGHFGFGGSGAWADPKRRLSVAMVNNRVAGGPFGDLRMLSIGGAVLRAAQRMSR